MAIIGSNSGKTFGGIFGGIKGLFSECIGGDNFDDGILGANEYLDDSDVSDIGEGIGITAIEKETVKATNDVSYEKTSTLSESVISAEQKMDIHKDEVVAPVAEAKAETVVKPAVKAEASAVYGTANSASSSRASTIIKPADFFSGSITTSTPKNTNGGKNDMNILKSKPVTHEAPKQNTERVGSAGVGFNYNQANDANGNNQNRTYSSQKPSSVSSSAAIVQFFEPRDTKQADDICTVLKAGHIVVVNLCNIREESDKVRIIDFVAGCCKGIDAKAHTIAPKSIFIAAPKGVELRKPVEIPAESASSESGAGAAPFFSGINFGAAQNSDRNTNAFNPRF